MMQYIGFDTSNYTTSAALLDGEQLHSERRLLPVREGQLGLRQSDAVFHHTAALPEIFGALPECGEIAAVGVSARPRDAEGSYMPCFLVGVNTASCMAKALQVPLYSFSHQAGHIAAALWSAGRTDLFGESFLAFHVSGGTTEVVLVQPDAEKVFRTETVLSSLDLKAGQAVDRVGVMLGFPFPAGKFVDAESQKSTRKSHIHIRLKDGCCSLSGLQNQCEQMHKKGDPPADICRYCLCYIGEALCAMADFAVKAYGNLPLVFSGGVMSNTLLRKMLADRFESVFAKPEFSCDNAAGIACLAKLQHEKTL